MSLASLVIPPWAKLAWRLAPWAAIAVLIVIWRLDHGRMDLSLAKAATTIERLNGALATQTAAIDALNQQQRQSVETREAAQAAQTEREKAQAGVIDRLSRYQRPQDGTVCPNEAGDTLAREMWGRL